MFSFALLDFCLNGSELDNRIISIHLPININRENISKSIDHIIKKLNNVIDKETKELSEIVGYYSKDNSSLYYHTKEFIEKYKNEIIDDLIKDNYCVQNRFNKHYVIAFAINYTRFEIYCKDCDKEIIKWRENDEQDPIKGIIRNKNYNENPVVALSRKLS